MVHSSENFINYSRNALISECEDILSERPCSNCGIKGRYAIWAIYCGEQPKQIHIQMTRTNGNFHVDIFDKNDNNLNHKLEQLPSSDPLCQLLSRAIRQFAIKLDSIVSNSNDAINASIRKGIGGDLFYAIYEEPVDLGRKNVGLGDVVFTENNFNLKMLAELLIWIEETFVLSGSDDENLPF